MCLCLYNAFSQIYFGVHKFLDMKMFIVLLLFTLRQAFYVHTYLPEYNSGGNATYVSAILLIQKFIDQYLLIRI